MLLLRKPSLVNTSISSFPSATRFIKVGLNHAASFHFASSRPSQRRAESSAKIDPTTVESRSPNDLASTLHDDFNNSRTSIEFDNTKGGVSRSSGNGIDHSTSNISNSNQNNLRNNVIIPASALKEKKTLVILGSGWGSVSLLKSIDTSKFNVIVVSPRNYFLFTPLLPSSSTGTIEYRSIMEPIRGIIKNKKSNVTYYEARATKIDNDNKTITIRSNSNDSADVGANSVNADKDIKFDYLVIGVGAQNSTFGIPGVQEHALFLKEIPDAQNIRKKIMDRIESASFKNSKSTSTTDVVEKDNIKRLLNTVVVGGGPTGVEFAAELQDFFEEDLKNWIPSGILKDFKVTLIEAQSNVLPTFSQNLIDYTKNHFKDEKINILNNTIVKRVERDKIIAEIGRSDGSKETIEIPYGLLVWATGNTTRPLIKDFMANIGELQKVKKLTKGGTPEEATELVYPPGILINEFLHVNGTNGIWALGDCTATKYAPTAQVAAQQGSYLGGLFSKISDLDSEQLTQTIINYNSSQLSSDSGNSLARVKRIVPQVIESGKRRETSSSLKLLPFQYSHQGSLAYIGSDRAVADLTVKGFGNFASGGRLTYIFWRSAYLSMCFSMRNRILIALDWLKVKIFGRDISRE